MCGAVFMTLGSQNNLHMCWVDAFVYWNIDKIKYIQNKFVYQNFMELFGAN